MFVGLCVKALCSAMNNEIIVCLLVCVYLYVRAAVCLHLGATVFFICFQ